MAPFFVLNLGIDTPFSEGVDGAPSMGLLSFPTPAVALFPSKERWSNPPSTGGVDGVLSQDLALFPQHSDYDVFEPCTLRSCLHQFGRLCGGRRSV
ncbi:hypothetical protein FF1_027396 [Malus domestica]